MDFGFEVPSKHCGAAILICAQVVLPCVLSFDNTKRRGELVLWVEQLNCEGDPSIAAHHISHSHSTDTATPCLQATPVFSDTRQFLFRGGPVSVVMVSPKAGLLCQTYSLDPYMSNRIPVLTITERARLLQLCDLRSNVQ